MKRKPYPRVEVFKEPKTFITVYIPLETYATAKIYAAQHNTRLGTLCGQVLEEFFASDQVEEYKPCKQPNQ